LPNYGNIKIIETNNFLISMSIEVITMLIIKQKHFNLDKRFVS